MISKGIENICCEDISLIENYNKAINDNEQTWICHHRNGVILGLSKEELENLGLYYNRPADELIFLTRGEHASIHSKGRPLSEEVKIKLSESCKGKTPWNKGLTGIGGYKKQPMKDETKKKISESRKGKTSWNKGLTKEIDKRVNKYSHPKKNKENYHGNKSKRTDETKRKMSEARKKYWERLRQIDGEISRIRKEES